MHIQFTARPHLSVHTRAKGHSSVAGAAYRLGLKLYDERTKKWHDYRKRKLGEEIVRALTVAPDGAPAWATDPAALWNGVESAEKRKDSQVARDYRFPVPLGLNDEQAGDLAEALARFIAEDLGTSVSLAVHRDSETDAFGVVKEDGKAGVHAHLYFPTRPLAVGAIAGAPTFGAKLATFRNQEVGAACIERFNEKWSDLCNLIGGQAGLTTTFDHRSYKRMGVTRVAEPKLGQAATALERKGVATRNGAALRRVREARGDLVTPEALPPAADDSLSVSPSSGTATTAAIAKRGYAVGPVVLDAKDSVAPSVQPVASAARVRAVLTPHVGKPIRVPRMLTQQERLESPVAWEPPPIVGLAQRFEVVYAKRKAASEAVPSPGIITLVRSIERALNALVIVAKALLHLDREFKRFSTAKLDVQYESEQKRKALDELRRQAQGARHPYTPRMSAAHRKRLAEIRTLEEEVADRFRVSNGIEEQIKDIAKRAMPWRLHAIEDRRKVKHRLALLEASDHTAVEELLEVANADEQPWLKLYAATSEPTMSLQKLVNAAEAEGRNVNRTAQKAHRPPV